MHRTEFNSNRSHQLRVPGVDSGGLLLVQGDREGVLDVQGFDPQVDNTSVVQLQRSEGLRRWVYSRLRQHHKRGTAQFGAADVHVREPAERGRDSVGGGVRESEKVPEEIHRVDQQPVKQGGAVPVPPAAGFRARGHPDKQEDLLEAEGGADAPQDHREAAVDKLTTCDLPIFILCHYHTVHNCITDRPVPEWRYVS